MTRALTCERPVQRDGTLVYCGKPSVTVLLDERAGRIPVCSDHEAQTSDLIRRGFISTIIVTLP